MALGYKSQSRFVYSLKDTRWECPFVVWGGNVLENSFPDYENGNRPHLI